MVDGVWRVESRIGRLARVRVCNSVASAVRVWAATSSDLRRAIDGGLPSGEVQIVTPEGTVLARLALLARVAVVALAVALLGCGGPEFEAGAQPLALQAPEGGAVGDDAPAGDAGAATAEGSTDAGIDSADPAIDAGNLPSEAGKLDGEAGPDAFMCGAEYPDGGWSCHGSTIDQYGVCLQEPGGVWGDALDVGSHCAPHTCITCETCDLAPLCVALGFSYVGCSGPPGQVTLQCGP